MIPYKITDPATGKEITLSLPFPEEITLSQLIESGGMDTPEGLAKLSFSDVDLWKRLPFRSVLEIIARYPDWANLEYPKQIHIEDKLCNVPTNLENISWGAHTMAAQMFAGIDADKLIEKFPDIIGIFMCEAVNGSFSDTAASDLSEKVGSLPAIEAFPLASFFLREWVKFVQGGITYSKTPKTQTEAANTKSKNAEPKEPVLAD